jgi:uncharacterized membrane protein
MNGAHAHLLVNHVPIFGVTFGLIALVWSLIRNSRDMRWAAIVLFVVAGIFGWIALETGEAAEDLVEKLPGVTKALIHDHEEAAEFANICATVLAFVAIGMAGLERFKPGCLRRLEYAAVLIAIVGSAAMARTAFLGGQVRHTEIRADAAVDSIAD